MTTTAVIVVFHSRLAELEKCLRSLRDSSAQVVVVDVSPTGEAKQLASEQSVTRLGAGRNLGYSWALNLGIGSVSADVVICSNSDIVYPTHAVQELATRAHGGGMWAPVQLSPEDRSLSRDTVQLAGGRRGSYARWLGVGRMPPARRHILARLSDPVTILRKDELLLPRSLGLSGACIAMSRAVFERLDGWDEGFFLYDEDTDISMRAHAAGIPVGVSSGTRVLHSGGYKLITNTPTISSPSCTSERRLWSKHSIGPELEIRLLQTVGIAARTLVRKLLR